MCAFTLNLVLIVVAHTQTRIRTCARFVSIIRFQHLSTGTAHLTYYVWLRSSAQNTRKSQNKLFSLLLLSFFFERIFMFHLQTGEAKFYKFFFSNKCWQINLMENKSLCFLKRASYSTN